MAKGVQRVETPVQPPDAGDGRMLRHFGDGYAGLTENARIQGYDSATLTYIDVNVDSSGQLKTVSGGGGGGPATIADGADVTQGALADAAVITDVNGTLSGKLRGLVKWAFERMPASLGQKAMAASLPVVIASDQSALTVASHAVTNAGTFATQADVTDRAARLLGVVDKGKVWDGTNTAAVKAASTAPAATDPALVVTLSPNGAAQPVTATQPVSLAAAVDVSDRAARLLGVVDKGKVWDGTNTAAVKAASALAVATDPALVVAQVPQRADASNLAVTATGLVNAAVTLTLPAPAAGLFHYITSIQVVKLYAVVGVASGAGVIITSTNLPGNLAWTTEMPASVAGTVVTVVNLVPTTPLKSAAAAVATTIVCPIQLQTIWRVNVTFYTAP